MKRSRQIKLILSGSVLTGVLGGCDPGPSQDQVASQGESMTFTNNHHVSGLGYYHAPYRTWFAFPYNYYSAGKGYYAGDRWRPAPEESTISESVPTREALDQARSKGLKVPAGHDSSSVNGSSSSVHRGGFGRSSFWRSGS